MLTLLTRDLPTAEELPENELPVRLEALPSVVGPGHVIMLADGTVRLLVKEVDPATGRILTLVEDGGPISTAKGVNLPDVELPIPSLTEKDLRDLQFALGQQVDYIAQSFVRSPDDIEQLRKLINAHDGPHRPQIIAKIEKRTAVGATRRHHGGKRCRDGGAR